MSILQINPASSPFVHVAAKLVLYLHIGAGSIGLLSGAAAFIFRKGSRLHRIAGKVFVVSMMIMSAIGASVAPFLPVPERASMLAGVLTFYLVLTAWTAVNRKPGTVGAFDAGMLMVSLCITAAGALFIWLAANSPTGTLDGQPRQAFFLFLILGGIGVLGDLRLIIRKGVFGAERIARHLWRMGAALFIATSSLFLGQPQVFAASLRAYLFVPVALVVAVLVFWLGRVSFDAACKRPRRQRTFSNLQSESG